MIIENHGFTRVTVTIISVVFGITVTAVTDRIIVGAELSNHEARLVYIERHNEETRQFELRMVEKFDKLQESLNGMNIKIQIVNDRQSIMNRKLDR